VFRDFWDFNVDASSDTGTEVGWASQDESEVLVPHEFVSVGFNSSLEFVQTITPSGENGFDVTVFLHGNDSDVVLFVDPDEEVFSAVVPDTSGIWPVSSHTGGEQEWGDWLVEQEVVVDELVLFGFSHFFQWVVFTGELTAEIGKSVDDNFLDSSSLGSAAPWWEGVASDGSSGSASGGKNVFGVKVVAGELGWVEASLVFVGGFVAVVSGFDDWVKEFLEDFVGLFVASNCANGHDEWMAWVVNTGLDATIDGESGWGLLASESFVHFQSQNMSHVVVVLFEVWVFILSGVSRFVKV